MNYDWTHVDSKLQLSKAGGGMALHMTNSCIKNVSQSKLKIKPQRPDEAVKRSPTDLKDSATKT